MALNTYTLTGQRQHRLLPSQPTSIIAAMSPRLFVLAFTCLAVFTDLQANNLAELPSLGNTELDDRVLAQEVTDDHIATAPPATGNDAQNDNSETTQNPEKTPVARPDNAWDLIRAADRLPRTRNERVEFYIEKYQQEVLWINKILHRGTPFIGYMVESLESRFLPVELALLPAIESGYQVHVKSSGNAAGIWQIVPITALEIGMERNDWFDGRGDIVSSTTAAIDYLSYLNAEFNGDWELTLAAYNAGPGRIRGAIKKNRKASKPEDFWSLDLPEETRNYVPKLVAMLELLKDPDTKGLDLPKLPIKASFTEVDVGKRISLDHAAIIGNLSESLLGQLNGGLIHQVTPPNGPHRLVLPTESADQFMQSVKVAGDTKLYSLPHTHEVVVGDTISSIAQKYGITQRKLRELNSLDNSKILVGQRLGVIDVRGVNTTVVEYIVKIGDTLSEIAQRYAVKVNAIRNSSGQSPENNIIHPGEKLTIRVSSGTG